MFGLALKNTFYYFIFPLLFFLAGEGIIPGIIQNFFPIDSESFTWLCHFFIFPLISSTGGYYFIYRLLSTESSKLSAFFAGNLFIILSYILLTNLLSSFIDTSKAYPDASGLAFMIIAIAALIFTIRSIFVVALTD
ncbi:MAG: hypothetical protein AAB373_06505 [Patescibacteria group bacterium]